MGNKSGICYGRWFDCSPAQDASMTDKQTETTLTKEEWLSRCAAHYVKISDLTPEEANDFAVGALDCFPDMSPEDAAEEDVNCWEHDE